GGDDADRRVAAGRWVARKVGVERRALGRGAEAAEFARLLERPRPEAAGAGHDGVAPGVDRDEGTDLEPVRAHRRDAAEPALETPGLGAVAGARIAKGEAAMRLGRLRRREGGLREVAIGRALAPILGAAIEEVEEDRRRDDRYARRAD